MRRWRFSALRRLACAAASSLLLGGCATSPVGQSSTAASVDNTRTGADAVLALLTRGNIPDLGNPAGIQLYAKTPEGVFLLVADHAFPSRRGWAGFGGAADKGETIAQTAARETEEETRGYFKRSDLLASIKAEEPVFDGKFAFYFVEVDWVPAEAINRHGIDGQDATYAERGPYIWVPYSEVECYLEGTASRRFLIDEKYLPSGNHSTNWFWPVWLNNFRAAKTQNALPW